MKGYSFFLIGASMSLRSFHGTKSGHNNRAAEMIPKVAGNHTAKVETNVHDSSSRRAPTLIRAGAYDGANAYVKPIGKGKGNAKAGKGKAKETPGPNYEPPVTAVKPITDAYKEKPEEIANVLASSATSSFASLALLASVFVI